MAQCQSTAPVMSDPTLHSHADENEDALALRLAAYPAQEPLSPVGEEYAKRVQSLGATLQGQDVPYGTDSHQTLTIFPAAEPNGLVLVFFHGGGWTNGYKEWMYFMAPPFNAHGITFVSATYRLAPQHVFPAGLNDCADAVAWVHRMLMPSMGSKGGLFVGGHSAGAHYAALLAVTDDWRAARQLPTNVLHGCIPISGVYRFGEQSGLAKRPRFLGSDPAMDDLASPLLRLSPGCTPPFFLSYGSRDFPHLIRQAEEMAGALQAASIPLHVEIMENCNHFEANIAAGDPSGAWATKVAQWMRQNRQRHE